MRSISMIKFRSNHTLLITLIASFLMLQWTTTHIHLTEYHNHSGSIHQHNSEVHSHYSIDNHVISSEFSHHTNGDNVVELDHKISSLKIGKLYEPTTVFIATELPQVSFYQPGKMKLPELVNTKLSHLFRAIIKSRAPPAYS